MEKITTSLAIDELIATDMPINGKNKNKIIGNNCKGEEKVTLLKEKYKEFIIEEFYTDSKVDMPLCNIAQKYYFVKTCRISETRRENENKVNTLFQRNSNIVYNRRTFFSTKCKILKISIDESDFYNKVIYNFINGGTGMFVFISGFLFYSVFYKKFEYKNFIKKKFQNVYIPYLLLSSITIVNVFFIEKTYKTYGFNNNHIDI